MSRGWARCANLRRTPVHFEAGTSHRSPAELTCEGRLAIEENAVRVMPQTANRKRKKDFAQAHHLFDGHTAQLRVAQAPAA